MTSNATSTTTVGSTWRLAPELLVRVGLEPARHLRDLGVGQAA